VTIAPLATTHQIGRPEPYRPRVKFLTRSLVPAFSYPKIDLAIRAEKIVMLSSELR